MTTIFSHVIAPVTNRFMRVWDENISRKEYRITRQNPNGKENFPCKQSTNGVSLFTWYLCESGVWTLWWKELSHHTFHHDTASLRWRTEHFLSVAGARARVTPGPCPHYLAQSSHRLGNSRVKQKSDCHTYCRNRPLSDTRIRFLLSNDIMTIQTISDLLQDWLWGESLGWNWLRAFKHWPILLLWWQRSQQITALTPWLRLRSPQSLSHCEPQLSSLVSKHCQAQHRDNVRYHRLDSWLLSPQIRAYEAMKAEPGPVSNESWLRDSLMNEVPWVLIILGAESTQLKLENLKSHRDI